MLASKFESNKRCINQIDGINDSNVIAEHFASHFERVCGNSSNLGASRLMTEYVSKRFGYQGQPYDENRLAFDAELIENVIVKMKRGKQLVLMELHVSIYYSVIPCYPVY